MITFASLSEDAAREFNALIAQHLEDELLTAERPDGVWDFTYAASCFPPWPWLQRRARCAMVIPELALMTTDAFEHYLTPLQEYVLYKLVESWIEVVGDMALAEKEERDAEEGEKRAERLQDFLDDAFPDAVFLNPALIARVALEHAELQRELDFDVAGYLELMPDDVRQRVEQALNAVQHQQAGTGINR